MNRIAAFLALVLCAAPTLLGSEAFAQAEKERRAALVIGNSAYRNSTPLPNPLKDARAVADALKRLGFAVTDGYDLTNAEMVQKLRAFGRSAEGASVALVFYAGHGLQVAGRNYLLPVDAALEREQDLRYEAVALDTILDEAQPAKRLRIVILDACRDNPFAVRMARALGATRSASVGRGLAQVADIQTDTLIAYATAADAVAEDGTGGNSPYTAALLEQLDKPGLEINLLFGRVRDSVFKATSGRQRPFTYGSLGGEPFYLVPPKQEAASAPANTAKEFELAFWRSIEQSRDPEDFAEYLRQFPSGGFAGLARNRMRSLQAAAAALPELTPDRASKEAPKPAAAAPAQPAPVPVGPPKEAPKVAVAPPSPMPVPESPPKEIPKPAAAPPPPAPVPESPAKEAPKPASAPPSPAPVPESQAKEAPKPATAPPSPAPVPESPAKEAPKPAAAPPSPAPNERIAALSPPTRPSSDAAPNAAPGGSAPDGAPGRVAAAAAAMPRPPAPPAPTGATREEKMLAILDEPSCAILAATVSGNQVRIAGEASPGRQLDEALSRIAGLEGIAKVSTSIRPIERVHCRAIEPITTLLRKNRAVERRLTVQPTHPYLVEGEKLVLDIEPPDGASFLTIDVYDTAGTVRHLAPRAGTRALRIGAGRKLRLGERGDGPLAPPRGQHLLVVIASPQPLALGERKATEPAGEYLGALHGAIEQARSAAGTAPIVADVAFFETAAGVPPVESNDKRRKPPASSTTTPGEPQPSRCADILERVQLGERITDADRAILQRSCK